MSHGIDETLEFTPVQVAVLTVSDSRTLETDTSGALLAARVEASGHRLTGRRIVPDDVARIREAVRQWLDDPSVDVIVTTGGTGLTGRDVTPEAVLPLLDKQIEGFSVLFHSVSFQTVGLSTLQSRAFAGVANGTFIFCLPGSNGAVRDGWDKVIEGQLDSRHRPCNLVELMPRLAEHRQ
jgi:molybdenum cofactor biosynthesis protein B